MARDVIDLMNYLGWTRNIHVIGVSMGGMIAQELVLAKPQFYLLNYVSARKEWLKSPGPIGSSYRTNEERVLEDLRRRIERTRLQPFNVVTGTWDNLINPNNSYYLAEQLGVDVECWE
ncbi:911_t:CDS:2, partial [Acaulospora colombiana]